jgi:hypothetical protein
MNLSAFFAALLMCEGDPLTLRYGGAGADFFPGFSVVESVSVNGFYPALYVDGEYKGWVEYYDTIEPEVCFLIGDDQYTWTLQVDPGPPADSGHGELHVSTGPFRSSFEQ